MFDLEAIAVGEKTENKLWERRERQKENHEAALYLTRLSNSMDTRKPILRLRSADNPRLYTV